MSKPLKRISEGLFLLLVVLALFGLADRLLITNAPEHYPSFLLTSLNGEKAGLVATRELCGDPLEVVVRRNDFLIRCGFAFPRHTWVVDKHYLDSFIGIKSH